jgi:hypothetical protein
MDVKTSMVSQLDPIIRKMTLDLMGSMPGKCVVQLEKNHSMNIFCINPVPIFRYPAKDKVHTPS